MNHRLPTPLPGKTFLPDRFWKPHQLCDINHQVLVGLLRTAETHGSFRQRFVFRDQADRKALQDADNVLVWLEATQRNGERLDFLRRTVFPAVLSDLLHNVFEALEASRKAKLPIAFTLLRKPLQESLFLLEIIASDPEIFGRYLKEDPTLLASQGAGGLDVHAKRIALTLKKLDEKDRFDAEYLAQLRYDKVADDGFDGPCNKAIHLFTSHKAIRTEPLNINFVFSDDEARSTQWEFLYSRLPYLLFYTRALVEHVFGTFENRTDPVYLREIDRRISAGTLLWGATISPQYRHEAIDRFIDATRNKLTAKCVERGFAAPDGRALSRMWSSGAYPGESLRSQLRRKLRYRVIGYLNWRHLRSSGS